MKKVLAFVLVLVMIMGMAVPAAALTSPGAFFKDLIPILQKASSLIIRIFTTEDILELADEIQELMAEAKKLLKSACPEGFAVKYFFYVEVIGNEKSVSASFEPIHYNSEIMFKQYIGGAWKKLDHTINNDKTITVNNVVTGPMAVFTK